MSPGIRLHFYRLRQNPIPARLKMCFLTQASSIPSLVGGTQISLLGLYLLFKRSMLRLIIYRIPGGRLLRPVLLNMLRINNVSASVILAGFCASTTILLIFESANTLADVYFSQVGTSVHPDGMP